MNLFEMTWPEVARLSPATPVVIPVAALEQHGHHLPVFTDSMLLGEIVRRVSISFADKVLFAPLMWLGNSDHHLEFPGTMSAPPRVYLDLLNGMAENFLHHGFRRILFLNGHGGNDVPGRQAVFELRQRHRDQSDLLWLFATYWSLGNGPMEGFTQDEMGHACEWETSMIQRIHPELVKDYAAAEPVEFTMPFAPASQGWITRERSEPGHIGSPHLATPEKGERLFARFTSDVSALLERVIAWDGHSWNG